MYDMLKEKCHHRCTHLWGLLSVLYLFNYCYYFNYWELNYCTKRFSNFFLKFMLFELKKCFNARFLIFAPKCGIDPKFQVLN